MGIIIAASTAEVESINIIIKYLDEKNIDYKIAKTNSIFEQSKEVVDFVQKDLDNNRGIIVDDFGIAGFLVTTKHEGIICALLNDSHSAKMTRDHNNANIISLGSKVLGEKVLLEIIDRFVEHDYAGGRHQIRVDMLNEMR